MKILYIALALLFVPVVLAVRIEEVYYDALDESSSEAILLFNPDNHTVNLSGYTIKNDNLANVVELNTVIRAQSYLLIADTGWNDSRDDMSWREADIIDPMTISNSDSGIGIFDESGIIIDKVGWGDAQNIDNSMYLGQPAIDVNEGKSLLRINASGNNYYDFIESEPQFRQSITVEDDGILLIINLTEYRVKLDLISIEDDLDDAGVQLIPMPGKTRVLPIGALVTHEINHTFINISMNKQTPIDLEIINDTSAMFFWNYTLEYNHSPGNDSLLFSYNNHEYSYDLEILPIVAMELDTKKLKLDVSDRKQTIVIEGDTDRTTEKPTITNIGNSPLNINMKIKDNGNLPFSELYYGLNNDFDSVFSGKVDFALQLIDLNLPPTYSVGLGLRMNINPVAEAGLYNAELVILGSKVQ